MSAEMTTPTEANRTRHSRIALGYIFIAVVSFAVIPTLIGHIGGDRIPFFFLAAWRAGVAVGCVAILITLYLPLWFNRYNWGRFRYHLTTSETMALSNLEAFGIDWVRNLSNQLSGSLRRDAATPPFSSSSCHSC